MIINSRINIEVELRSSINEHANAELNLGIKSQSHNIMSKPVSDRLCRSTGQFWWTKMIKMS